MIVISPGSVMRGDLVTSAGIRLDGRFDGRLVCSRLEISSDGYLNGTVSALELIVAGQIVGQVEARAVHLEDGAFIEGDIRYASIVLEAGATMTGKAIRLDAGFVPAALRELQTELNAADAQLDHMEHQAREEMAKRAAAEYPAYEKAKRTLVALR